MRDENGEVIGADLGALVRRLILFEQVIVDSFGMRELPALIDALGAAEFVQLLHSGAVAILADAWTVGELGNAGMESVSATPLPLLTYSFGSLVPRDKEHHIGLCLGEIRAMQLGKKMSKRVRAAIVEALVTFSNEAPMRALEPLAADFTRDHRLIETATIASLREKTGIAAGEREFTIRVEQTAELIFQVETNLGATFRLSPEQTDDVVEKALLAVAGLNQRFAEMQDYQAVIGFRDSELVLAERKLAFLLHEISADAQEERFGRIVSLAGLPDVETTAGGVNVDRLLEARDSSECREFRHWLRTIDDVDDAVLAEMVAGIQPRLAEAVHGGRGKLVRFVLTSAVGVIPVVGAIAGPALGAVDQFLVDKVIPEPGPLSFIGSTYRSLFD